MDLEAVLAATDKVANKYQSKQDAVRWTAFNSSGQEINRWTGQTNCYSAIMGLLPSLEIRCLPSGGPSPTQLPALWYHHFFRLLKRSGLVPPEVKTLHRNGANCLIIPRAGWDRHTLYITLCCYRQSDIHPAEVMRIMLLYRRLASRGVHFLQCLHYGLMTSRFSPGHAFMSSGPYGGGNPLDLAQGQALAWFAQQPKKVRLSLYPSEKLARWSTDNYTCYFLPAKAKEMKSIKVKKKIDILDPQYAPLYEEPQLKNADPAQPIL
jgi:hypothetical protein